jgi:hypothetical protein
MLARGGRPTRKAILLAVVLSATAGFLVWRLLRPMNIFVVSEAFERPVDTRRMPAAVDGLHAADCGRCHDTVLREWQSTMHSQAWTDPYFQTDWRFEGSRQVCRNCHTPLDRQQEALVLGFRDRDKWDPILAPNADFDPALQGEGVTCAACHLRDGAILGPYGDARAPHPVKKIEDANEICVRCHVVAGARWDTFYRFPPCGTAAEIAQSEGRWSGRSGEYAVGSVRELGCVECHMPLVERALVAGGDVRTSHRHLWRGGHDPAMVAAALDVGVAEVAAGSPGARRFALTIANVGTPHYLPTGTPDRHLTVQWRLLDAQGKLLDQRREVLERMVMWRPFIVDLWDTRLRRGEPRVYGFEFRVDRDRQPARLEVVVRYHLLHESRRARIGYANRTPVEYAVFEKSIALEGGAPVQRQ